MRIRPVERGAAAVRVILSGTVLVTLLTACSTARIEQAGRTMAGIDENEAVVLLARQQIMEAETEESFMSCLHRSLANGDAKLNLYPAQAFVDGLFPWFEPRTAPPTPDRFGQLLGHSRIRQRLAGMGVRYLVWVDGDTDRVDRGGGISCAIGPGGGGCFGFAWWEKESSYEASIWDLEHPASVGKISADVKGTSYLPALIVPIPLIARTQTTACKGLAEQLKEFMGLEEE